jgi:hypothetical protein
VEETPARFALMMFIAVPCRLLVKRATADISQLKDVVR